MVRVLSKEHRAHVEALEIGRFRMAVISHASPPCKALLANDVFWGAKYQEPGVNKGTPTIPTTPRLVSRDFKR